MVAARRPNRNLIRELINAVARRGGQATSRRGPPDHPKRLYRLRPLRPQRRRRRRRLSASSSPGS